MKSNTILALVLGAIIIVLGGYVVTQKTSAPASSDIRESGTTPMAGSMNHNMHDMMVSSERAFIEGMIPHHQEAVDTAKEVLARGATTGEIRSLLENIITAQEKEIADMKSWYQAWYGVAYTSNNAYTPMMRDLEGLSGKAIDATFLEDMIMHHMGAIMMAHSVTPYIEHAEMTALTKAVTETQSAEIERMQNILEAL